MWGTWWPFQSCKFALQFFLNLKWWPSLWKYNFTHNHWGLKVQEYYLSVKTCSKHFSVLTWLYLYSVHDHFLIWSTHKHLNPENTLPVFGFFWIFLHMCPFNACFHICPLTSLYLEMIEIRESVFREILDGILCSNGLNARFWSHWRQEWLVAVLTSLQSSLDLFHSIITNVGTTKLNNITFENRKGWSHFP